MTSKRRRTTTKSGGSGKSRRTDTSARPKSSSPTSPASFAEIFGEAPPVDREQIRLTRLLERARERQAALWNRDKYPTKWHEGQAAAAKAREARNIRNLQEALKQLTTRTTNS